MIDKTSLRNRLLSERMQLSTAERDAAQKKISSDLKKILATQRGPLGFYWPVRGEFDPREVVINWLSIRTTNTACLPVIVKKNQPLVFKEWNPNQTMTTGTFNIATPGPESRVLTPKVLLVPTLGFNQKNYRLGYGGGYYDRTLTDLVALTIGLCFQHGKCSDIREEAHDIPLDIIIVA